MRPGPNKIMWKILPPVSSDIVKDHVLALGPSGIGVQLFIGGV
jgi:hypothetical protein